MGTCPINRRALLAGLTGLAGSALTLQSTAALAGHTPMPRDALAKGDPVTVIISIREQQARVYAGTTLLGSTRISSGKPGHDTPQGIFSVLDKRRFHESNIYSGAEMPYMQRLTWSGIALHEGKVPKHPASHGCIRFPGAFASDLFKLDTMNRHVVIADAMPEVFDVTSPLLFQPQLPRTASLDDASSAPSPKSKGAPVRIYLTRHTGKHRLARVQHMLSRLGFYDGTPDGTNGQETWRAIVGFQKSVGMKPTGVIRGQLLPILEAAYGVEESPQGHLYVRQNREPVFDMPVHIDGGQALLGTHLFTMGTPSPSGGKAGWTALTVDGPNQLGGTGAALEALARFRLPADARTRIEQMLTPHSSLAISDTGLGHETGKGTDFIVLTQPYFG